MNGVERKVTSVKEVERCSIPGFRGVVSMKLIKMN